MSEEFGLFAFYPDGIASDSARTSGYAGAKIIVPLLLASKVYAKAPLNEGDIQTSKQFGAQLAREMQQHGLSLEEAQEIVDQQMQDEYFNPKEEFVTVILEAVRLSYQRKAEMAEKSKADATATSAEVASQS